VTYRITIKPTARKELEALSDPALRRVDRAIAALASEPQPHGSIRVRGTSLYRIRAGEYRVLYQVDDRARVIDVVGVGHRREIYR